MEDKYNQLGFNEDVLKKLWGFAFKKNTDEAIAFLNEISSLTKTQAKHIFDSILMKYNTPELNKILDLKPLIIKAISMTGFADMVDAAPEKPEAQADSTDVGQESAIDAPPQAEAEPSAEGQSPAAINPEGANQPAPETQSDKQ